MPFKIVLWQAGQRGLSFVAVLRTPQKTLCAQWASNFGNLPTHTSFGNLSAGVSKIPTLWIQILPANPCHPEWETARSSQYNVSFSGFSKGREKNHTHHSVHSLYFPGLAQCLIPQLGFRFSNCWLLNWNRLSLKCHPIWSVTASDCMWIELWWVMLGTPAGLPCNV